MTLFGRLVLILGVISLSSPAWAQATRTWVSGVGDDANPCSRTAPCKTWAGAISKTTTSGEIDALDPGGFGALTITKAITLDGNFVGGVLVAGTDGIDVDAPGATVILRHMDFDGIGGQGLYAINVTAVGSLHVEDSYIYGFSSGGINFNPTSTSTTSPALFVLNTRVEDNYSTGATPAADITVSGSGSATVSAIAMIEKCQLSDSSVGLQTGGTAQVTVHDSVIANQEANGVLAGAGTTIYLDSGVVTTSLVGIQGTGTVYVADMMVSDNGTGIAGTVNSFGNNRLNAGNTTTGTPTATLAQQ